MRARTRAMATAAIATLALLAAACQPGNTGTGTEGGAESPAEIAIRGCTPQNPLIASNTGEVCGGNVIDAITAKLVHYNAETAAPEMDIAESIETEDNINFTVKIKPGYKFHDGTEVLAKNFVDTWNWVAYAPNGQYNGYFMEPIEGYADLQCGDDECKQAPKAEEMTGLAVVDDHTFTIKTSEPVSNLPVRLGYTVFAPQPDAFFADTTEGKTEFAKMPIGAGPFKMVQNDETAMVLEKFADYSGEFTPQIDKVTFRIYNDANSAYTDVVADNLDFTDIIPADALVNDQWKMDLPDRTLVRESGVIQSLGFSPVDEQLADINKRKALSMSLNRDLITKEIFQGTRIPATGWVSPVVDGYKADACGETCVYNEAKAKELWDAAGGYDGQLLLSVNGDGGHKPWADAACNNWRKVLGVDCVVNVTPDFKTIRNQLGARELKGLFRSGWQMDYPSIENFLAPIYTTGASSNDYDYSSATFDDLIKKAAAAKEPAEANSLYQQAEAELAKGLPTVPKWYAATPVGWSTRVDNVKVTPFGTLDLSSITVK
ncbi:peptide ABC transporter substrate-binding protein [Propionibacteriaceae bacterium Y2011]